MKEEIRFGDCPEKAKQYPGPRTRHNPNGCVLSKEKYITNLVLDWVKYLKENCKQKYDDTPYAHRMKYLSRHLDKVKKGFKKKELLDILLDAERSLNEETEQELMDSQDIFMEVEV